MGIRSDVMATAGDGKTISLAEYDRTPTQELRELLGVLNDEYSGEYEFTEDDLKKLTRPNLEDESAYESWWYYGRDVWGAAELARFSQAIENGWTLKFTWG